MSSEFIITRGETKVAELVTRLYGSGLSKSATRRAARAIADANPQLAGAAKIPEGVYVVVPSLRERRVADRHEQEELGPEVLDELAGELNSYLEHLEAAVQREYDQLDEQISMDSEDELLEYLERIDHADPANRALARLHSAVRYAGDVYKPANAEREEFIKQARGLLDELRS